MGTGQDGLSGPLPWQEAPWSHIQLALQAERLPHALMLQGQVGLGKGDFACLLAKALLCDSLQAGGVPCQQCKSCRLYAAGNHPDLHELTLLEDKHEILIDQVREINHWLQLATQCGGYRIVLINPADQLNLSAANSLLKVLEEPVGPVMFLLVLSDVSRLPMTIRSRCQNIVFPTPEGVIADPWLARWVTDPAERHVLLNLANGAPYAALQQYQAGVSGDIRAQMFRQLAELCSGAAEPLQVAGRWLKSGPETALYTMYTCVADLVFLTMARAYVQTATEGSHAQRLAARLGSYSDQDKVLLSPWSVMGLFRVMDKIHRAIERLSTPANQQLLLEELAISWAEGDSDRLAGIMTE